MGKPVIVSDAPAMDFVEKGKFGLSVKYGSHTDLEKALEMILIDSAISKEFGKNGRAFVLENYSWPIVGKEFESVYNNL
jgi:glycosyltransferase involved in cell wall biosynthesis